MTTLKELQEQLRVAERALYEAKEARSKRESELVSEARTKAFNEFKVRVDEAWEKRYNIAEAELAERNRLALEGVGAPFPVGTRMVEWERYNIHGRTWSRKDPEFMVRKTGVVGVVEVITVNSVHPESVSSRAERWNNALVGDAVIRLCKKDGTLGKRYLRFGRDNTKGFRVEGVTPNQEELK